MLNNTMEAINTCGEINTSSNKIMVCSTKEFLHEERRTYFYLELIPKEVKDEVKSNIIPTEIKPLLV